MNFDNLYSYKTLLIYAGIVFLLCALWVVRKDYSKREKLKFKILFHTDAHAIGCHGNLIVDCPAKEMQGQSITFVMINVPSAPALSLSLMEKIFREAELCGYHPIALKSYIGVAAMTGGGRPVGMPTRPTAHIQNYCSGR